MSRSERLLALLQLLRQYRYPVKGQELAEKLGISLRSLYRDIKTLQSQGATIEGEAGMGYILHPGYTLPPLMFLPQEIEALVVGMRWVNKRGDPLLQKAAEAALAKITSVLPSAIREQLENTSLFIGPAAVLEPGCIDISLIRQAVQQPFKVTLTYCNLQNNQSTRTIWPLALAYFDQVQLLVAWCELRQSFRHFRVDRILSFEPTSVRYPGHRQALLKKWRCQENISSPSF